MAQDLDHLASTSHMSILSPFSMGRQSKVEKQFNPEEGNSTIGHEGVQTTEFGFLDTARVRFLLRKGQAI